MFPAISYATEDWLFIFLLLVGWLLTKNRVGERVELET